MAWVLAFVGLVGLLQGIAWLGGAPGRKRALGAVLAPLSALLLILALTYARVPGLLD